jgi:hypothetical protein
VAEYSRADAAKRSGVDLGYIDRLIELGVISPDRTDLLTKGDLRRAQMAQTLEYAGIGLESRAASIKGGHGDLGSWMRRAMSDSRRSATRRSRA